MISVFYKKMDFIGNKKAVGVLERSLEKGALNHAYIFSGPEKVGKAALAKMFALSAIAGKKLDSSVDYVDKDAVLDLIIVRPEVVEKNKISKQRDISIEVIRESKQKLSLFPYHGKYKILIVEDAHRMNVAAQNGLLKSLEEPNPTTIIILVTHELDRILPTILSRCQMVNFSLVSDADMLAALHDDHVVSLAIGRPGLARTLSNNPDEKIFRMEAQKQFERIMTGSLNERFILADEYSKDIPKALEKLNIWIWEMRKHALNGDNDKQVDLYGKIEKIQKSMSVLKRTNANGKLILETLFMDM